MASVYGLKIQVGNKLDAEQEHLLVEKCRRQNMEAYGLLVDAYESRIFGFVKGLVRNREEALDVTQEVFVRAFQAFHRFDGRSSLRTWLFRIAHNLCIDRARREERNVVRTSLDAIGSEDSSWDVPDQRENAEQSLLDQELHAVVARVLERMSEKLRSVLVLHDQEDLSYEEIAKALSIPVGTVKSRLFLARSYMQEHLKEYLEGVPRS